MTESVGQIFIELTLEDKKYTAQLQAVGQAGEKAGKQIGENISKGAKQATTSFQQMETVVKSLMYKLAALYSIQQVSSLIKETALLASRFETMGIVMNQVAKTAGFTTRAIEEQEMALRKQGITMLETRSNLTKMMQAQIDVTQASKLARIAQDAAVIGDINSSQAFERMINGIQTGNILILRNIGLNVSNEQAYAKLAATLKKKTTALTQDEKMQARVNAVMEEGIKIQGVYEAAMTTSGKKLKSLERYVEDFKVKMGEAFGPAMVKLVDTATEAMKNFALEVEKPETREMLAGLGKTASDTFEMVIGQSGMAISFLKSVLDGWNKLPPIVQTVGIFAAVFGGIQGIAAITGISLIREWVSLMTEAIKLAEKGKVSWNQIANAGNVGELRDIVNLASSKNPTSQLKAEENMLKERISSYGGGESAFYGGSEELLKANKRLKEVQKQIKEYSDPTSMRDSHGLSRYEAQTYTKKPIEKTPQEIESQLKANLDAEKKYYNEAKFEAWDYYDWKKKLIEKEKNDNIEKGVSSVTANKEAQQELNKLNNTLYENKRKNAKAYQSDMEAINYEMSYSSYTWGLEDIAKKKEMDKAYQSDWEAINYEMMTDEQKRQMATGESEKTLLSDRLNLYKELLGSQTKYGKEQYNVNVMLYDLQYQAYKDMIGKMVNLTPPEKKQLLDAAGANNAQQKIDEIKKLSLATGTMYEGFKIGFTDWTDTAETAAQGMARVTKKAFSDMTDALTQYVRTGKMDWRSLADSIVDELIRIQIQQALVYAASGGKEGSTGWLGTALSFASTVLSSSSAKGNIFNQGSVTPFAQGGIFDKPTIFPMANGTGLMGEAGPEAVMPLSRGIDGKLGVKNSSNKESSSEGGTNILINAVDAKSFEDLCKRNPAAITGPILQSLRDNKTRTEFKRLVN